MELYKVFSKLAGQACHASWMPCHKASSVSKLLPIMLRQMAAQQCSTKLRSGDIGGHGSNRATPLAASHALVRLLTWQLALSCWNNIGSLRPFAFAFDPLIKSRAGVKMSKMYDSESCRCWQRSSKLLPFDPTQSHTMTDVFTLLVPRV